MSKLDDVTAALDALQTQLTETDATVELMFKQIADLTAAVNNAGTDIPPAIAQTLLDKIAALSATAAKIPTQDV